LRVNMRYRSRSQGNYCIS